MITSSEIRNVTFSNSMAGYKKDEVDILLDKIEVDLEKYESNAKRQEKKIEDLQAQIIELKESQSSIQNVLLNAQKLADKIVEDAKQESQKIVADAQNNIAQMTEKGKQIAGEFDAKATEKKEKLENELSNLIKEAEDKKGAIEKATAETIENQQILFDKIKLEIANFKKEITDKYKEHLTILSAIPDAVDVDPTVAAKLAAEKQVENLVTSESPDFDEDEEIEEEFEENIEEQESEEIEEDDEEPEESEEIEEESEMEVTRTFSVTELDLDE